MTATGFRVVTKVKVDVALVQIAFQFVLPARKDLTAFSKDEMLILLECFLLDKGEKSTSDMTGKSSTTGPSQESRSNKIPTAHKK